MHMSNAFAGNYGLGFMGAGFGSWSFAPTGQDCPAGGSWEAWCACMYSGNPDLLSRCNKKFNVNPFAGPINADPTLASAPWTVVGGAARGGLPAGSAPSAAPPATPAAPPAQPYVPGVDSGGGGGASYSPSGGGIPMPLLIGGGLLAVGALAMMMGGRRGGGAAVAGFGGRRRRK